MATVNTNDARTKNALNLIDSFNECDGSASAYMFIGRTTPWDNDDEPPVPNRNKAEYFETHREMLSLKRIMDTDVHMMIPRLKWVSGAVYDMYRHDYTVDNRAHSNAANLYDAIYFVLAENNNVYVCLDNHGDKPSLVEPQNLSDEPFITSDGYQWIRLFKVSDFNQKEYSTNNLIPIVPDNVNQGEVGAVYTVVVEEGGARYTQNPQGPLQDVPDYYCHITGDGRGAVAKVKVRNGSVVDVEVVKPGSGYTFARVDFTAGRVFKGLRQLEMDRNPIDPQGDGKFRSTVIITPPGGWGSDLPTQLASRTVGVFSSFSSTLADFYPDVTFRQIGIMHDVEVTEKEYENAMSLSAVKAIKVAEVTMDGFQVGEIIKQEIFEPTPGFYYAYGRIVSWDADEGIIRYVQTEDTLGPAGAALPFGGPYPIVGQTTKAEGQVATDFAEESGGVEFWMGYADSEIKKYVGRMTYLTNIRPVMRHPTQTERISLCISF